jgi:diamine N-acetyltransferase
LLSLQGEHIKLRALEPEDLELLARWENDTSNWGYSQQQVPFSRQSLKAYLANAQQDIYTAKQLRLVIENNGQAIGLIDLYDFDFNNCRAGIGILIATEENKRRGFAKEALQVLLDYAKKAFDLKQVYASIGANNSASLKLFKSVGFKEVGVRSQWFRQGANWEAEHLFQLIFKP